MATHYSRINWPVGHLITAASAASLLSIGVDDRSLTLIAYGGSLAVSSLYVRRRCALVSASVWFFVAYTALFYVSPIVGAVVGDGYAHGFGGFRSETIVTYNILAVVGIHLLWIGREFGSRRNGRDALDQGRLPLVVSRRGVVRAVRLLMGVQVLAVILLVIDQGGVERLFGATRVELLLERSLLSQIASFLLYGAVPLYVLLPADLRGNALRAAIWVVGLAAVEVTVFYAFRIRSVFIAHLVALAVGWLARTRFRIDGNARESSAQTRRPGRIPAWKLAAILVLVAAVGIVARFARGHIGDGASLREANIDVQQYMVLSVQRGDLGYSWLVMTLIEHVPERHEYLLGQSYWRLLAVGVPRALFPGKPLNTERVVARMLYPNIEGLTLPPGVVGDLYINFGVVGILGMVVFGWVLGALDGLPGIRGFLFAGATFTPIFHFTRGGFTNSVLLTASVLVACGWIARAVRGRRAPQDRGGLPA